MGAPLQNLVHPAHRQARLLQGVGGTGGGSQGKPQFHEIAGHPDDAGLVHVAHAEQCGARLGRRLAGTQLGLGKGGSKGIAGAHHLAGGAHFRAQNGVHPGELVEGQYRLFHAEIRGHHLAGEALPLQGLADHATGGHLGQGDTDALGYEGHGARRPGVHLDNVDLLILPGQLHIHQALHPQLQGHLPDLLAHLVLDFLVQAVGGQ